MIDILGAIGAQVFIFFLIWWIVLFTTLPLKVTREHRPEPGHDPGAPTHHNMKYKALLTTAISLVIWVGYFVCVKILGYSVLDLPI